MNTEPGLDEIRDALKSCFEGEFAQIFLFGSRATGTARYNSDWDIGVLADHPIPGHVMARAREALDSLRTLHTFDVVDFCKTNVHFRGVAMRKIIPLAGGKI